MSAFSSAKANTEFELKFTAPAALLLGVAEPIANKTAAPVQLGANLAAARRALSSSILASFEERTPGPKVARVRRTSSAALAYYRYTQKISHVAARMLAQGLSATCGLSL